MDKAYNLVDQNTEYYYEDGVSKPYVEIDEIGNFKLSPIIDRPKTLADGQLLNFLRTVREVEHGDILPQTIEIDNKGGVMQFKEAVRRLVAIDINNRNLFEARKGSLGVTRGLGYTTEIAQSMINACNIANGLYDIAYSLNYKSAKEEFSNLDSKMKGYIVGRITDGVNSLGLTKPVYWNDEVNSTGKRYSRFYDGKKQLIQHGVYTAEQLREDGTDYLSKGNYYVVFPQSFAGLIDSDYAFHMSGVMNLLDKLTRVSSVKDETFKDAPLFEMYLTNPLEINELFNSLVNLVQQNNYTQLNERLKSNAMDIIGRMFNPDNVSTQNLIQIITNQESKFFSRLEKSGIVEQEQAARSLESVIESMSRKVLPLIRTNPELIATIFQNNPDFIRKANNAGSKKVEGKEEISYPQTKNLVNSVGLTIADRLRNDPEIRRIIKEKNDNGKKVVKLSQIEAEIRQRYAIESDGIFQKGADIALALSQTISQRGEIAIKKNNDPLITSLLQGKTLEFFKDEILFRPEK